LVTLDPDGQDHLVGKPIHDVRFLIMRPPPPPWLTAVEARIPPRTAHEGRQRQWVLGICLGGGCEHGQPAGERFTMAAGDVISLRPGTPQRWVVTHADGWDVVSCIFDPRPHWLPWLEFTPAAPGFLRQHLEGGEFRAARRAFMRACAASGSGRPDALDVAAHAIEEALLICRRVRADGDARVDPRVRLALAALAEDLSRPLGLDELATRSGASVPHLLRLFRRHVGASPAAYLARLRHQRAAQLLRHSDLPIKAVARAVGFADQRYFSSWFRRLQGRTPSAHRADA
jgi:AraC-like DNA-binding protein